MPDLPYIDIGGVRYYAAPNVPFMVGYDAAGTQQWEVGGKGETFKGFIPLDLGSAREVASNDIGALAAHGSILATDSTPTYERINAATDKGLRVLWAASNVDALQFSPVVLPPDLDSGKNLTFHALAVMSGATDTPTIAVAAFFGVGDSNAGGATDALSGMLAEVTCTIGHADIPAPPNVLSVELTPGAHTTDTLTFYAAWLEYTRK